MNAHELALIEDPPSKCPYFTLPDVLNFLTPDDFRSGDKHSPSQYNSLVELFGQLDKMSDNQQTQFLFHILKHCTEFKPDFEAVAESLNLSNSSHVARRFKSILQKEGFEMNDSTYQIQGDGLLPVAFKPPKDTTVIKKTRTVKSSPGEGAKIKAPTKRRARKTKEHDYTLIKGQDKKKPRLGLVESLTSDEIEVYSDEDAEFEEGD